MAIATQEVEKAMIDAQAQMIESLFGLTGERFTVEEIEKVGIEAQKSLREEECPICFSGMVQSKPGESCGVYYECNLCRTTFSEQELGSEDPTLDQTYAFETGYTTLLFRRNLEQKK